MYIEEIILEGFKTYVNRTVISSFDAQFNAITGLNGSGKSNIIDAIQFLIGSTNKEMLRLKSGLTELISGGGTTIEKASVCIKFRCVDKKLRPTGYENCEQLLVTRQITRDKVTKFFVNGLASNLTKVRSLFRSVHLNIQNPHFLVKQGQITKIINLKPLELLGMIQETAGTAIYNKTKIDSERMIEKKQHKLRSIQDILGESIKPQMNKLTQDRRKYTAFKNRQSEMKELHEAIKTYEFMQKCKLVEKKQYQLHHNKQSHENKQNLMREQLQRLGELEGKIKSLRNKKDSEIYDKYSKAKNEYQTKSNQINQIKKRLKSLQDESISNKQDIFQSQQLIEQKKQEFEWKQKQILQQEKQKEDLETLLNEIKSGTQKDAFAVLEKQLFREQNLIKQIQGEIKIMNEKMRKIKSEAQDEKRNQNEIQETKESLVTSLKNVEKEIEDLQKLSTPKAVQDPQLSFSQMRKLQNDRSRLLENRHALKFGYNDPCSNFDRTKVKGRLFMLFKVKQKIHEKALEIGAGGKLQNIVVENEQISKLVIERDTFGKNVSVIPNNKIRYRELRGNIISQVKKIGASKGGFAAPAYQLIQFNPQISNSMMFAFGNFIVCSSTEIGKLIAYSHLKCKCVTYDGDVLESGTLTGGFLNTSNFIIGPYEQLRTIEEKIKEEKVKFHEEKKNYDEYKEKMSNYRMKKKQLEGKYERREKLNNRITDLSFSMKKRNYAKQTEAIQQRIVILKGQLNDHREIERDLNNKQKKGGKSIEDQQKEIFEKKKKQEKDVKELKKTSSMLEVEMEEITKKMNVAKESENSNQDQIINLQSRAHTVQKQIQSLKDKLEQIEQEKLKIEKEQALNQSQLQLLINEENSLRLDEKRNETEVASLKREIESVSRLLEATEMEINELISQCSWLSKGRQYDVEQNFNYEEALNHYRIISLDVDKLKKTAKITIDDHSYEKLQEEFKNLEEKKEILKKDRLTLLNNMHDLDDKRTKTLENCFGIVKDNLGKIFNDLLPGATAHLNLIDKHDVTKGVELQVQFNKVRKDLSQLSGGQRSLLALSFILALLLYKPSPFYILDEIDSALDLSHTENIGYMISQRFPQSQFILISLKEGMYQNANVLYKVHFTEGESKVDRQILRKK